ncbi:P4htm [Symbiodinium sp. CCMP2592]|nr:P4htm [Symbiodinium sp. CCMP2592]
MTSTGRAKNRGLVIARVAPILLAVDTPYLWTEPILSGDDCTHLMSLARAEGMKPSFAKERAMQSLHLRTRTFGFHLFDFDASGDLSGLELAAAAKSLLNAPLFSAQDARAWSFASTGKPNLSLAWLDDDDNLATLALRSREAAARILEHHPERLARHSFQASLPWDAADLLAVLASQLKIRSQPVLADGSWSHLELQAEPLQVIRYTKNGHYAPHSDSGWPGHRRLSFLVYLQAPIKGGETCLLPAAWNFTLHPWGAGRYRRHCAELLQAVGAVCLRPVPGRLLAWRNDWNADGSLEVPGAHVACPVVEGEKWVASAWASQTCDQGTVCQTHAGR